MTAHGLRCSIPSTGHAGIAAPITAAFGLLIARIVVRQQFKGKKTIEFTTMLCLPYRALAGVSYILAFNSAPGIPHRHGGGVIISMVMRTSRLVFAPGSPDSPDR